VLHQSLVFLLRPRPFLHSGVVAAARRPPHHTRLVGSFHGCTRTVSRIDRSLWSMPWSVVRTQKLGI
jgi:hypothetical protein